MHLRDAGIAGTNLVLISSIFPPQAKLISRKEGLKKIKRLDKFYLQFIQKIKQMNHIEYVLHLWVLLNQKTSLDMDIFLNTNLLDKMKLQAGDYAEDIAAQMLASSLGIPFDADKAWNEKRQQWSISGEIYKTHNITQTTKGDKDGKWTTVFAAAVLLL